MGRQLVARKQTRQAGPATPESDSDLQTTDDKMLIGQIDPSESRLLQAVRKLMRIRHYAPRTARYGPPEHRRTLSDAHSFVSRAFQDNVAGCVRLAADVTMRQDVRRLVTVSGLVLAGSHPCSRRILATRS